MSNKKLFEVIEDAYKQLQELDSGDNCLMFVNLVGDDEMDKDMKDDE